MAINRTLTSLAAGLLILSASIASAEGPAGVEPVGAISAGVNFMPATPLSVLYLQRSQLLMRQMDLTVDLKDDERQLNNELIYKMSRQQPPVTFDSDNKILVPFRDQNHLIEKIRTLSPSYPQIRRMDEYHVDMKVAKSLVDSVDKKRHALDQLKTLLDDVNAEIKRLSSPQVSKNPGGAAGTVKPL